MLFLQKVHHEVLNIPGNLYIVRYLITAIQTDDFQNRKLTILSTRLNSVTNCANRKPNAHA